MTAAREFAASASERAETYLRLRAEAELRTALGFPQVKLRHPERRSSHSVLRRSLPARLRRRQQRFTVALAAASPAHADNVLTRVAGSLRGLANFLSTRLTLWAHQVRWRWMPRTHRVRWRWMPRMHRRDQGYEPPPAEACIGRLYAIATALTGAGALSEVTAMAVVSDLRVALAARSLIDQDQMLDYPDGPGFAPTSRSHAAVGPVSCYALGIAADCEIESKPSRIYLSTLVVSPARATMEVAITFPEELTRRDPRRLHAPLSQALRDVTARDDRGGTYDAHFSGGGSAGHWEGRFHFVPVPPAGLRWLDVTVPGGRVVRVSLDSPAQPLTATYSPLPAGKRAERYLDAATAEMLLTGSSDDYEPEAVLTVTALLESDLLQPDSPAVGRFAAAAALVGIDPPTGTARIPPQELPAGWHSLIARRNEEDGPTGVVPFAAVLPELDGARCVLTGLRSEPERAELQMHAQGWPDRHGRWHGRTSQMFRWAARDDVGGWYITSEGGGSWGGGEADLELWLHPAINPQARALELILTGPTGEVSVTVPLEWREGI
jgi:hypothetical protein